LETKRYKQHDSKSSVAEREKKELNDVTQI